MEELPLVLVTHHLNDVGENLVEGLVTGLLSFPLALVLVLVAELEVIVGEAMLLEAVHI